ncbi:acetyl-coenzyme A synthetase 2, putative [Babesia caballi]|uniref:acetate--CoA ligase n=1 Tax=Babesia caballi TaxID=5871 RepID=A0AAV4M0V3_BABCB|nr:acetyl-coenzyme A synthetase 2, putative [Babesia caballi]
MGPQAMQERKRPKTSECAVPMARNSADGAAHAGEAPADDVANELCSSESPFSYDRKFIEESYATIGIKGHQYHISDLVGRDSVVDSALQEEYREMHRRSIADPDGFWGGMAREHISWIKPFSRVSNGSFENADYTWFEGGRLNACENCVDRWAEEKPDAVAIIFEGDDPKDNRQITFRELRQSVCRYANVLKAHGVRKGDTVTLYMSSIPALVFAMLACARIGAVHSVIFGGFSAASLAERIREANSQILITVDEATRGGKRIQMKNIADEALASCPDVKCCLVVRNVGVEVNMVEGRDKWLEEELDKVRPYCPVEPMDSEDILFILYTSGSTGRPKGVAHTTAGYLLYAFATTKYIFDAQEGDIFGCMADVGWITGHTYVVYGPLLNGLTTFVFSSLPNYPDPGRYWRMVEQYRITQFYTAPTAIRGLMRSGDDIPRKFDMASLRILGSVGEPINPEAWRWYHDVVGRGRTTVVDTYWQTETGGIVISPIPGVIPTKAGSATVPFFGIDPVLVDSKTGREIAENNAEGLLALRGPWPGLFRTLFGSHQRGVATYFAKVPGCYLTGDAAYRDRDGYLWINGRVDDTLNVSGHRIGSADIEHALVQVPVVAEAAAVSFPHPIKGQAIFCFVTLKDSFRGSRDELVRELRLSVRKHVGPFATPDIITATPHLPKTRSGKIMRRILRKLVGNQGDDLGDTSTLADPSLHQALGERAHGHLELGAPGGELQDDARQRHQRVAGHLAVEAGRGGHAGERERLLAVGARPDDVVQPRLDEPRQQRRGLGGEGRREPAEGNADVLHQNVLVVAVHQLHQLQRHLVEVWLQPLLPQRGLGEHAERPADVVADGAGGAHGVEAQACDHGVGGDERGAVEREVTHQGEGALQHAGHGALAAEREHVAHANLRPLEVHVLRNARLEHDGGLLDQGRRLVPEHAHHRPNDLKRAADDVPPRDVGGAVGGLEGLGVVEHLENRGHGAPYGDFGVGGVHRLPALHQRGDAVHQRQKLGGVDVRRGEPLHHRLHDEGPEGRLRQLLPEDLGHRADGFVEDHEVAGLVEAEGLHQSLGDELEVGKKTVPGLLDEGGQGGAGGLLHAFVAIEHAREHGVEDGLQPVRFLFFALPLARPSGEAREAPAGDAPHEGLAMAGQVDERAAARDGAEDEHRGLSHLPVGLVGQALLYELEHELQNLLVVSEYLADVVQRQRGTLPHGPVGAPGGRLVVFPVGHFALRSGRHVLDAVGHGGVVLFQVRFIHGHVVPGRVLRVLHEYRNETREVQSKGIHQPHAYGLLQAVPQQVSPEVHGLELDGGVACVGCAVGDEPEYGRAGVQYGVGLAGPGFRHTLQHALPYCRVAILRHRSQQRPEGRKPFLKEHLRPQLAFHQSQEHLA